MGASLRDIRKRISSVKSTQQITKAMKMVAAAKLRRAEQRARSFSPYAAGLESVLQSAMSRLEGELTIPLATPKTTHGAVILLVAGDRGLCGGYNSNIFRIATRYMAEHQGEDLRWVAVGKKAIEWVRKRGLQVLAEHAGMRQPPLPQDIEAIGQQLVRPFLDGEVGSAVAIYNRFVSAMTQVPEARVLLPFATSLEEDKPAAVGYPFLLDGSPAELVSELVEQVFQAAIMRVILEAQAGEHGSRMTAMDSATTNAAEMIGRLTLVYNRARQAAITNELMDIVNGSESLK